MAIIDVVYLDLLMPSSTKSTSKLPLANYIISESQKKIHEWIHSFLTHRTQSVILNGAKSKPEKVLAGVPQGSVLGPLLFLIILGDIDADVTKAYISVSLMICD